MPLGGELLGGGGGWGACLLRVSGFYHCITVLGCKLCVCWRFRLASCLRLPVCPPRFWLQRLQMMRRLSSVSVPPLAHSILWSGSALFGCRPCW